MKTREHGRVPAITVESRYLEPNLVSLRFASLELYNFNPDFSKTPGLKPSISQNSQ